MNAATVNIKDYILDLATENTPSVSYEIVLQNNTDFIISRSTAKTKRELVILISQGLYYIKDDKKRITQITLATLKTFLKDLKTNLKLEQVYWMPIVTKDSAEKIEQIISDDLCADMCRHNVLPSEQPAWYGEYWKQNSKLFLQLHSMFPNIADGDKYMPGFMLAFELDKKFGYNEAIYFANQLVQSGVAEFTASDRYKHYTSRNCRGFMDILENSNYNLQLRRLIDYVLFDLYGQGIASIDHQVWRKYNDYLEMQLLFFGKIKEKYPPNLKTAHDIISLKTNQAKEIEQYENFAEQVKKAEHLAYQNDDYCIVVPTQPQEIADEGVSLNHCVRSYIGRVANGECHILFLRKTGAPDQSHVTLQLCGDTICQTQGGNRHRLSQEERLFLEQWAAEKDIRIAA